jgi:hypothetical protein
MQFVFLENRSKGDEVFKKMKKYAVKLQDSSRN